VKEEEDDSLDDREFETFFDSHLLAHANDDRRGITSRGSRKNSFKYRALVDDKKVSVPPLPAQNSRGRNKTPSSHHPAKSKRKSTSTSTSTSTNGILPQKLFDEFQNEIEISAPMADIDSNESSPNDTTSTSILGIESPDESEEHETSVLKNIFDLFKFDISSMDKVDESQTDFNRMLSRMPSASRDVPVATPFGDDSNSIASWSGSEMIVTVEMEDETTDSETTTSGTIDRVIAYLSHLRRQTGNASHASSKTIHQTIKYLSRLRRNVDETYETHSSEYTHGTTGASICLNEVKNGMTTLAKTLSSAADEATVKTVEHFQENGVCSSIMKCTNNSSNVAVDQSVETYYSPLDRSWFIVDNDSDTISKLSQPNEENMFEEYCF